MKITIEIAGNNYAIDTSKPVDISQPIRFDGNSITAFGAPHARSEPYQSGTFHGDTRRGGSCNCELYIFSPHLHGTHTECVGHITDERIAVHDVMKDSFIPATLITVTPETPSESYDPLPQAGDTMITKAALEKSLKSAIGFLDALIIRTDYTGEPPYFSREAMEFINTLGVKHLLVDMPSVDRLNDDGKLSNHRIFWGIAPGVKSSSTYSPKTITELIKVPASTRNGTYMLNLQIAPFMCDAAPSRPLIYEVKL
ncbi:MAG TPA: cyclase family protein [Alphaproteobacteria bacterium]